MNDIYRKNLPETDQAFAEQLRREAEAALPADKGLAIHFSTIETLRAKGYAYREIAKWFDKRGVKVNHVDVWRAHKNGMKKEELFDVLAHDEEWSEFVDKKVEGGTTEYSSKEGLGKRAKQTKKGGISRSKKG